MGSLEPEQHTGFGEVGNIRVQPADWLRWMVACHWTRGLVTCRLSSARSRLAQPEEPTGFVRRAPMERGTQRPVRHQWCWRWLFGDCVTLLVGVVSFASARAYGDSQQAGSAGQPIGLVLAMALRSSLVSESDEEIGIRWQRCIVAMAPLDCCWGKGFIAVFCFPSVSLVTSVGNGDYGELLMFWGKGFRGRPLFCVLLGELRSRIPNSTAPVKPRAVIVGLIAYLWACTDPVELYTRLHGMECRALPSGLTHRLPPCCSACV